MDTYPSTRDATPSAVRLLIHSASERGANRNHFEALLRRLLTLFPAVSLHDAKTPLSLQIDNAQGSQVFAVANAGPLVEVALPAGRYHIKANLGKVQRTYWMSLQRGASVDLFLHLAPGPP